MTLDELFDALPKSPVSLEDKARAVLGLLDRVRPAAFIAFAADRCPNCGGEVSDSKRPYCSETCRDIAALVRQMRRALAEGTLRESERQISVGAVLWHQLGGGYPLRVAMIPPATVRKVIEKSAGRCEVCGGVATTVDHIRTACNRPINLRAVCATCSKVRAFGDGSVVDRPESQVRLQEIADRVGSSEPVLECDDPLAWDWREFLRRRKAAV